MRASCIVCCMKMIRFELAILSVLFGTSSFGMVTSTPLNYTYRFDVYTLENCPKNAHEFETAAKRKNCTGNSRYLCAPDKYLSNLIEFCTDRPVSLFKNGHCVRLEGTGDLNHYRCEDKFQRGCPTEPYTDEEIYKYPACLEINIGFHCFAADKDCPERLDKYVSNNSKKEESINITHTEKSDGSIKSHVAIVICVVYALMMTTVTGIIAFFVFRQRNKKNRKKTEILLHKEMPDEEKSIKTGQLRTETSIGESGTDTCEREEKEIKTVLKMDKDKEITIRHIRGIIVGCGGAGKTTLLERLKGTSYHDLQKIESTVIADVHPNCFEVLEEDQNIKYVGSDRTKPTILLHEGMLHEKRSIKTDLLKTEITRKDDPGTDSRKRKELSGRMPNIETKNDPDQRRENYQHDIEKIPPLPDLEKILPEERAHLPMQSKNEKNRNEIETNKDENYSEILNAITEELNNELSGRKHLPTQVTFLDFAGQSMYYAFHQIFLSPKTFYILVVDMTKRLDDKVEKHLDRKGKSPGKHEKLCSRFQSWEYKDYYKFWLESINRFSDKNTPVIIVGTHAENLSETECDKKFDDLYALFDNHHHLKKHLNTERRYAIGIPTGVLKLDELKEIKECIAEIAQCPIYSEHSIRFSWAVFERFLQEEKTKKNKKIISREDLLYHNSQFKEYKEEDDEISKLLECLYMAGTLLYFDQEKLKDTIILDLQWFVDAFKCIIKYEVPKHETDRERNEFQKTGELLDKELVKIWKQSNDCFLKYKEDILPYMERLELLAIYKSEKADSEKYTWYYVPSMNKRKFDMRTEGLFKSSILCFDFSEHEHNPIFIFYRLSLKCSKLPGWTFRIENNKRCIYENVVCLTFRGHIVVICVCNLQIQVQVFRPETEVGITFLQDIQKSIEQIMRTYQKYCYEVGYKCQRGKLNDETDNSYLDQKTFPVSGAYSCPMCTLTNVHSIDNNICWVQIEHRQKKEMIAKIGGHLKEQQRSQVEDLIAEAAMEGNIETVKSIIRQQPSAVDKTFKGKTALQFACFDGHIDIVKFLLESKANPNFQDSEGDSPLHFSAHGNEPNAMVELLNNKANVNIVNKKKQTPLHIAVGVTSPECIKILLKANADPSMKDIDGGTQMHDAIAQKNNQSDIVKYLLESPRADFSQTNGGGFNVLHWAALKNSKLAVEIILKKKPQMANDKMSDGIAALHLAAVNNCIEIANILIKSGQCDVNIMDKKKRTPLILCVSQGHQQMMELLIGAGSKVNAQDSDGNTALHVAMLINALPRQQEMDTEIICALLEAKADINIKNKDGELPLDLAGDEKTKQFMISLARKAEAKNLQTTSRGIGIPPDWEPMTSVRFKRVPLSPNAGGMMQKEYKMVAEKFNKTLGQATILQIERVQNVYSWQTYQWTRRNLEHKYGGVGCANEEDLFHGTDTDYIDDICKDNFDTRLAGKRVGTLLGYGTYFSRDAKYADLYAGADKDRNKYMFLAKVLCGKWDEGNPNYRRPPNIDPKDSHSELYDSCVDNVDNPKIFCIYDKNQFYPSYLIKYK